MPPSERSRGMTVKTALRNVAATAVMPLAALAEVTEARAGGCPPRAGTTDGSPSPGPSRSRTPGP
jgi:hypothetical protein